MQSLFLKDYRFLFAKIHQALFFWRLSDSSCIPYCLYALAEIGSSTQVFFDWEVGGQEYHLKKHWLVKLHVVLGRCAFCWNNRLRQALPEQFGLRRYLEREAAEGPGVFAQQEKGLILQ